MNISDVASTSSHRCDFCIEEFSRLDELKDHIFSQHLDTIRGISPKVSENVSRKVHKEKSSKEIQCEPCDMKFDSKSKLLSL